MLPHRNEIKKELIAFLSSHGPTKSDECYKFLKGKLGVSAADLILLTNDGELLFNKEVRWAKKDLVDANIIKNPNSSGHGIWELMSTNIPNNINPILCDTPEQLDEVVEKLGKLVGVPKGQVKPSRSLSKSEEFVRDAVVVAYVLQHAKGICECCDNPSPFTKAKNGAPYLEVHHVKNLTNGGSDTVSNAIATCPNCHRELHFGLNSKTLAEDLYVKIERLMRE